MKEGDRHKNKVSRGCRNSSGRFVAMASDLHEALVSPVQPAAAQPRALSKRTALAISRLLKARGLSDDEIDRAMGYALTQGADSFREVFELAMSRAIYSDAQLAEGMRFNTEGSLR